jgi:hypothetical protein
MFANDPRKVRRYAPVTTAAENERGAGSGDRSLLHLITELTDEGMVWPLQSAIDHWGRERAVRKADAVGSTRP